MADVPIPELPAASTLTGTELTVVFQGGVTKQSTASAQAGLVSKASVGLGSVDNTADTAKPVSVAQQAALDAKLSEVAAGASIEDVGAIESNVLTVASSGSSQALDLATYGVFDITMNQSCTFTFSNPAPSGKATMFTLILRGAFTPTLPASIDWSDATPPTYTTPSIYVFTTVNAGTTYFGAQMGKGFA